MLPVLLTLGRLLDECKTSFFYVPNLGLFGEPEGKALCELDTSVFRMGSSS